MARMDSLSSTSPHPLGDSPDQKGPPIAQHPRPSTLTRMPDRPNGLVSALCISISPAGLGRHVAECLQHPTLVSRQTSLRYPPALSPCGRRHPGSPAHDSPEGTLDQGPRVGNTVLDWRA